MKKSNRFLNILSLISLAVFSSQIALSQDKNWEGELEEVEIEIIKERQISLPKADRNFDKIPPRPAETIKNNLQYEFRPFSFQTPQVNPSVKPLKLKADDPSQVFGGYISAGYGNYASPYLEGFINTKRNKNKLIGAHAYLRSSGRGPVDGKNSGSGNSGIKVFAKSFTEAISLEGEVAYNNRSTHFYGYEPDLNVSASQIRQSYNTLKINGALSNAKNTAFTYKLGAGFSYLADKYDAKETEIDLDFNSSYKIDDESAIGIKAGYYLITRKDSLIDAKPRSLFTVNPSYQFYPVEDLKVTVGIIGAFENDSIDSKNVHAYPDIQASYPLSPSVELRASVTGGMEKVSLQSLSNENIWLAPNVPIFHTNKLLDFQASLHSKIGNKVSVNGGFSFATLKNWYFFLNEPDDQSKFITLYDTEATKRTNFFASLGFAQTEAAKFLIRGDLFTYSTDEVKLGEEQFNEAWHRPTYKLTANASFNVVKKLLLNFNVITQGGMKAYDFNEDKTITLDPALDLNARVEYLLSEKASVFFQFNNITSNKYPVFLNYPVRGFQVLGGLTWSF